MRPPKYLPIHRSPSAFAAGSAATWFSVVKDGTVELSRLGGGRQLAAALVTGLHLALVSV